VTSTHYHSLCTQRETERERQRERVRESVCVRERGVAAREREREISE